MSASRRLQLLAMGTTRRRLDHRRRLRQRISLRQHANCFIAGARFDKRASFTSGPSAKRCSLRLRLGYVVIPPDLVESFRRRSPSHGYSSAVFFQAVLTDFMNEGHFARHIRRMRMLYGQRRAALVQALQKEFGVELEILGAEAGMHLAVILRKGFRDRELANHAARQNLWLWPLSSAYLSKNSRHGFVLGFGSTSAKEMPRAVSRLKQSMESSRNML